MSICVNGSAYMSTTLNQLCNCIESNASSRPFSFQGSGGKRIEPLVSVCGKAQGWTLVGSGDDTPQRFGVVDNLHLGLVWILG